jgi:hypothetical protein
VLDGAEAERLEDAAHGSPAIANETDRLAGGCDAGHLRLKRDVGRGAEWKAVFTLRECGAVLQQE